MIRRILDKLFPARICKRKGHNVVGFMSMGPHFNNPEKGVNGGVFYGSRYVIRCTRCGVGYREEN